MCALGVMDAAVAAAVDEEAVFLARGNGRLREKIGRGLDLFVRLGGHREYGCSSVAAYALERLSRSGRWAGETRTVARRMGERRLVRAAFLRGEIGWVKAELVLRHATAENERELVALARTRTVRRLRAALRKLGRGKGGEGEHGEHGERSESERDEGARRTLEVTVPLEKAWECEAAVDLVRHLAGPVSRGEAMELMLAEGTSTLFEHTEPGALDFYEEMEMVRRTRRERDVRRAAEEPDPVVRDVVGGFEEELEDEVLPHDVDQLDALLVAWSAELASRDLWLGKMLSKFFAMRGWEALGYVSDGHYARERLGMSRSSAYERIRLARGTTQLDAIAEAVQKGEIGFAAARLLVRVATRDSEKAWVERARRRTYEHLREEVELVERDVRLYGRDADRSPPTAERVKELQRFRSRVRSGEVFREALETGEEPKLAPERPDGSEGQDGPDGGSVRMSARRGEVTLRFVLEDEVYVYFKLLEGAFLETELARRMGFVEFLASNLWRTWLPMLGDSGKCEEIFRRDGYECASPVCLGGDVTWHHVKFRAHGGGDEPENGTSACWPCHGGGIHEGRIRVTGTAPDGLVWAMGRRPWMVVRGRERELLR